MTFHSQHRAVIYENTVLLLDPEVLHRKNVEMQQKRKCNNKDDSFWSRGGKNERQSKPEED